MRHDECTSARWLCPRDGATKGTALAPSQHLRSTLGKTRPSRLRFAAVSWVLVLGATLVSSACGTQEADAAAIVDGTVIRDKDVQTVSQQINTLAQGQQKLTSNNVLLGLILAPYVSAEVDRAGKSIPDSAVLKVIDKVNEPSPTTVDFVRMRLAISSLTPASQATILTELGKAKITVNPRYGTFDVKQIALVPVAQNWIKAGATSEAK